MITISLCMIVKNEEKVLERCLNGLKDIVDEIIIVDTGSTDRTKEIAAHYTKDIYDFQWIDDFSAARNFSFSKATKDYIYVADADEIIDKENQEQFLKLKQILLPEIDIVQMLYCNQLEFGTTYNFDEEYRPKLYKRLRPFVWEEPIHEAVRLEPIIFDSDIRIEHKPLNSHADRDFSIYLNLMNKGKYISKKLHTMYAKELYIVGEKKDFVNAIPLFEQTMVENSRSLDEVKEAACVLARAYRLTGMEREFFKNTLKEVASNPSSEICYELGEFYLSQKDYKEAVLWYYNAVYETSSILNIHCGGDFALERLALCYEKLGDFIQAEEFLKRKDQWEITQ